MKNIKNTSSSDDLDGGFRIRCSNGECGSFNQRPRNVNTNNAADLQFGNGARACLDQATGILIVGFYSIDRNSDERPSTRTLCSKSD